nr:alpha/beta hydrolase [Maritimibacter sp. DP1N21-5]
MSTVLRFTVKPYLAHAVDPEANRRLIERGSKRWFRAPPFALYRETALAPGLRGLIISARPGSRPVPADRVILYIHGGGFIAGSPETHRAMLARIAWLAGVEVVAPDYRIAPEHPFPAAIEDCLAAWDALLARGYAPEHILLGGDSAGGNIALVLLSRLLARGTPPAGLFALSPITDFTFSGGTMTTNLARDSLLPARRGPDVARWYLAGADPAGPEASPLNADFPDPPPILLQYAETEILCDDCVRLGAKLRASGGEVTEQVWPDAPHVFQIFDGWLPEARDALRGVADFARLRLNIH